MEATPHIESHLNANMNIRKKDIILGNFLGGLFWGIGSVIGATIVVAIIGLILSNLGIFDFLKQLPQTPQLYK